MSDYTDKGGLWLLAARSWIQSNCSNGDRVIWGGQTVLGINFTAARAEEFAARVADAANSEADLMKSQIEKLERKVFDLQGEVHYLRSNWIPPEE